jgi:CP family cyanate transporter-like MFS transporter
VPEPAEPARPGWPRWLIVVAVLTLALNLRPTAIAIGPQLRAITDALSMSGAEAGLLTTLPVLCFAGFGVLSPGLAARIGLHRALMLGLLMMVTGQAIRAVTGSAVVFLAATTLALAGLATANILLPSLIKRHFPDRIGLLSAAYSTALATGVAVASFASVPIADASGQSEGWRWGLGIWALTAIVAVPAWVLLAARDRPSGAEGAGDATITIRDVARTRVGWILAAFFGLQALQAYAIFGWLPTIYIDAGYSAATAGAFLGIATSVGIPLAFVLPAYAARHGRPIGMMIVIVLSCLAGYLGLLIAPTTTPWLWAVLLAIGTSAFPVILTLIGLRARTSAGTSALSGFSQSVGYLLAAPGPFLVGVIHDATGTWTVPLLFLAALTVPFLIVALLATRPRLVEDEVG